MPINWILGHKPQQMTRGGLSLVEESRCFVLRVIMTCGGVSLVMESRRSVLWVIMTCDIFLLASVASMSHLVTYK